MVASGLLQALRQLHTWHALTDTAYGRLIITKTMLFLAIVFIAWFSREAVKKSSLTSLRATVIIELVFAAAVVVVTTILISTSPTSATDTAYDRSSRLGSNTVTLHIDHARVGPESMTISVNDSNGDPIDVPEVQLSFTLANEGIGPLNMPLQAVSAGRFASTNATAPIPGTWTARVTVRTNDVDQSSTSFAIPIS
jgi:copper transport protein